MRVPFDSSRWDWNGVGHEADEHLGRPCVRLDPGDADGPIVTLRDVEIEDGVLEVELAVGAGRSFPGVVWRARDAGNCESFFVRPHQVGNPDAIQYTPVSNGISSWQLYHGEGFWSPISFPTGDWFRIRVAFAGTRAEIDVAGGRALLCELKRPVEPGRIGILAGAADLRVSELTYDASRPSVAVPTPAVESPGVITSWLVSDPFPETELAESTVVEGRTWTPLGADPSGLLDLARLHPIRDGRDTVYARAIVHSEHAQVRRLDLGFSDRALLYVNGTAFYRGDDSYRSRDYRFLGSIGWWDSVFVPLLAGTNELVVAVSETFGGWGVQARFADPSGLSFSGRRDGFV